MRVRLLASRVINTFQQTFRLTSREDVFLSVQTGAAIGRETRYCRVVLVQQNMKIC